MHRSLRAHTHICMCVYTRARAHTGTFLLLPRILSYLPEVLGQPGLQASLWTLYSLLLLEVNLSPPESLTPPSLSRASTPILSR